MRILIFALLILEFYLGFWATKFFGFWMTFLIYFVPTFFALPLVIFQNQLNFAHFQKQMATGQMPDQSLFRLAAGFIGSLLMLVPSLICRTLALVLLFPPTRFLIVFLAKDWFGKKVKNGSFKTFSQGQGFAFGRGGFQETRVERDAQVIDIEAIKIPSQKPSGPTSPKT